MRTRKPKISVGMPVYNGEAYLRQAIEAILCQTFGDFEFVISDNASTDGTEEICRSYAEKDSRIVYIRNRENIGAANNYNQLFHKTSGEYFRWFNCDDLCSDVLHERCLAKLEENPDAVMCYGKTDIIDGRGDLIQHYDDNLDLQQDAVSERFIRFLKVVGLTNAIYGLMRRSALKNTKLMGDGSYPAADTNLMAELSLYGKFIEIPETLFYRRMHQGASSWDRKNQSAQGGFWTGKKAGFVMPTFKKEYAFLRAIFKSHAASRDKAIMRDFILKRMLYARKSILRELLQTIAFKVRSFPFFRSWGAAHE